MEKPIIIAHRGASGYRPEHTLESYRLAVEMGADFVEPDLVSTKDGHLIARHDNVLNLTTDVADREEFADRKTKKTIDGETAEGWFSEDFTLEEIKTLRAVERIPDLRPANTEYDGQYGIPTLQEIIALVRELEAAYGRTIGIYIETKHPSHFAAEGLSMEPVLLEILHEAGYTTKDAPIFLQSFEVSNLKWMRQRTELPLVQLLWLDEKPVDVMLAGGDLTYGHMATAEGLKEIAQYADGVGPAKFMLFEISMMDLMGGEADLMTAEPNSFVHDAHAAGLQVHPYTFRAENAFLPPSLRSSDREELSGLLEDEILMFMRLGVDGLFTDNPDIGIKAKKRFLQPN